MPTFGSLFSGIGGLDLGLERAGWSCAWQVEIDPFCRRILARHWPAVPRHRDVRAVGAAELQRVDLIAGGFPCQDVSVAGKQAGLAGARSGLWFEYARIVRELRPRFVLVENVPGLAGNGLGDVLGSLASLGYDAEWDVLPAAAFGAPHLRERIYLVAYPGGNGVREQPERDLRQQAERGHAVAVDHGADGALADAHSGGFPGDGAAHNDDRAEPQRDDADGCRAPLADADRPVLGVGACFGGAAREELAAFARGCSEGAGVWAAEPRVRRVADGVPSRVDRLRSLGNAVVPQVGQWLGERLMAMHTAQREAIP